MPVRRRRRGGVMCIGRSLRMAGGAPMNPQTARGPPESAANGSNGRTRAQPACATNKSGCRRRPRSTVGRTMLHHNKRTSRMPFQCPISPHVPAARHAGARGAVRNNTAEHTFIRADSHTVCLRVILGVHDGRHRTTVAKPPVRIGRNRWHRHLQHGDDGEQMSCDGGTQAHRDVVRRAEWRSHGGGASHRCGR